MMSTAFPLKSLLVRVGSNAYARKASLLRRIECIRQYWVPHRVITANIIAYCLLYLTVVVRAVVRTVVAQNEKRGQLFEPEDVSF